MGINQEIKIKNYKEFVVSNVVNNPEMLQYIFDNAKVGIAICDVKDT
jgi:hypothetical protein